MVDYATLATAMNIKSLSVFFPCINEEGNLENIVNKAEEVLKKLRIKYEIIIVDDGSTDATGAIADKLTLKNSNIKVIHHHKNLGYGEALKSGFYNANYDTIVYTDGDGQFNFSELTKFLEKIQDHDVVIGYRIKRQDSILRKLFGKGWRLTLLTFFGLKLKDVDCGFKMVRRMVLQKIPHLESQRGAMINAELAIKAKKAGFRIAQTGVSHYPRLSGKPTGANIGVIIKSYIDLIKLWWSLKDEKLLFIILVLVIFLAGFLRFYKISEYMTFLGDEGRDAIIVKEMLIEHHFPLIGPPTSVGNIYLGPLYYYMMAVSMMLFWLNPVAAAGLNAVIGIATVVFIYYLGKIWFNRNAGLVAAYLYAISPVTIIYSKSSWNPNPAPFFALVSIFGLYKLHRTGNFLWLTLTGLSIGAAVQMHYLAVILIPIAVILWIYEVVARKFNRLQIKNLPGGTLLGVISFIFIMFPLVWFDLRHGFLNYRAITELLSGGSAVKSDIIVNLAKLPVLFSYNLVGRYIAAENIPLAILISLFVIFMLLYKFSWPKLALGVWLIVGLIGLTFYQQSIYDHYLGFLNPAPFLLLGSGMLFVPVSQSKRWLIKVGITFLIIVLTVVNFQKSPLLKSPNNQLKRIQEVAKFVINQTQNKPFNFALLAQRNYDSAYQFYLDIYGHRPLQVPFDITDQLFVVCEDDICQPINNPKYEIAGFGWAKVVSEQKIYGVQVFKLVHNPSGKP